MTEVKVFGSTAMNIAEGEEFVAKVSSVSGHKVVTLVRKTSVMVDSNKNDEWIEGEYDNDCKEHEPMPWEDLD